MKTRWRTFIIAAFLTIAFTAFASANAPLTELVQKIQPAVVKIVVYDMNNRISGVGSGFFINRQGHLITNYHVLNGAFSAEVIAQDGGKYPIDRVIAQDRYADLIKVTVDISQMLVHWLEAADATPNIAERVLVVGSPLGLAQSVSEGIVSAVREIPNLGKFFQTTAPISPGSSGSPVIDMKGRVIGIVTFQSVMGQNINFAVSSKKIFELSDESPGSTIAEWTYSVSSQKPKLAEALCRKGFYFSVNGEYQKALVYYRHAAEKDPTDIMAWYGLSQCYVGLGKSEAVIDTYKQAIRINLNDASLRYNLGNYYRNIGKNAEAIEAYRSGIAIDPNDPSAYTQLGILYSAMGRYREALEAHRQAVRIDPGSPASHFRIGTVHLKLDEPEAAVDAYHQAILLDPEFGQAYTMLGTALERLGRLAAALNAFKKAIEIDPDDPDAHYHIGVAYLGKGDRAAALQEYKILKALDEMKAKVLFERIYN